MKEVELDLNDPKSAERKKQLEQVFRESFTNLLIHRAVAVIYCCLPLGLLKEQVKNLHSSSSPHMPHTCAMILSALLCRNFSHLSLECFITSH